MICDSDYTSVSTTFNLFHLEKKTTEDGVKMSSLNACYNECECVYDALQWIVDRKVLLFFFVCLFSGKYLKPIIKIVTL